MGLSWRLGAVLWAVAEASFFFIVPDVLLTAAALKFGLRKASGLAALAAVAAALAGLAMWQWAHGDASAARAFVLWVPAIDSELLARVNREIADDWFQGLTFGAVSGVPYKLYAIEAGARGLDPWAFFAGSIFARFCRFVLAIALVAGIGKLLAGSEYWRWRTFAYGWGLFYATYFAFRWFQAARGF